MTRERYLNDVLLDGNNIKRKANVGRPRNTDVNTLAGNNETFSIGTKDVATVSRGLDSRSGSKWKEKTAGMADTYIYQ